MEIIKRQYGPPQDHHSEEARSRYLAPMFNRIVAQFHSLLVNTPESMMEGLFTTKGRIEYQFRTCGSLTVVLIKLVIGSTKERLDAIAQVLAEADACDYDNYKEGFHTPIHGILSDGTSFQFFRFERDGMERFQEEKPKIMMGITDNGYRKIGVLDFEACPKKEYIRSLRPVCETIFFVLLQGFIEGLEGLHRYSSRNTAKNDINEDQSDSWDCCKKLALECLDTATAAARSATRSKDIQPKNFKNANSMADDAWRILEECVKSIPNEFRFNTDDDLCEALYTRCCWQSCSENVPPKYCIITKHSLISLLLS
ncbi:hypothetical protein BDD12DRAFT_774865 [Trichophaea hybrida]|nr:hypothetical protein BDD12DRAFT_774865 [Trichophaea hybrida]